MRGLNVRFLPQTDIPCSLAGTLSDKAGSPGGTNWETDMPIILWLLGVPLGLVVVLWLLHVI
jgi:hypothetical protein